jgi:hypothetical protein
MRDLHRVVARPGDMPVKVAPAGEVPLELLIKVVDSCLRSGFKLTSITLDPTKAK